MKKKSDINKKTRIPKNKNWTSKQKSKEKRVINFRISRELDSMFKQAVLKGGFTQTEIMTALVESYVKWAEYHNHKLDEKIEELIEQREYNERKVIASALDDAIERLNRQRNN